MPSQIPPPLVLRELRETFSILRYDPTDPVPTSFLESTTTFVAVTRTPAELSVICPTALANHPDAPAAKLCSDNWRCLRIELASLPDETPGIIAAVVNPLGQAGISTFAVATFDTDHLLVQDVEAASEALTQAGHTVYRHDADEPAAPTAGAAATTVRFRSATPGDSSDLAVLGDAATRRLLSWVWDTAAEPGQSSFEVGRNTVYSDSSSLAHHSQWRVAEVDDSVAGALNSYLMKPPAESAPTTNDVLAPLAELKSIAAGSWYISVASVFPEARGNGVGQALLTEAERLGRAAGAAELTLLVASFNTGAQRLYERVGFRSSHRRSFHPFPGSGEAGDWILMVKDIAPL